MNWPIVAPLAVAVTPPAPGIDDNEMLKPVGDPRIEVTDEVSKVKEGPGVNTRPLISLTLKLAALAPTVEVSVPEVKVPVTIFPMPSIKLNVPAPIDPKMGSPTAMTPVMGTSKTKTLAILKPLSMLKLVIA
jgi:hypothetical protein